jgi:hypothetical protein
MKAIKNRDAMQNIKLRRELMELRQSTKLKLTKALSEAEYDRWVQDVNQKIAECNRRIRSSNN